MPLYAVEKERPRYPGCFAGSIPASGNSERGEAGMLIFPITLLSPAFPACVAFCQRRLDKPKTSPMRASVYGRYGFTSGFE